jgi:hypothetical protein
VANKLIRDIPDEDMACIEAHARAAGKSVEAWCRDVLIASASAPIIRERYALRFYCDSSSAHGLIQRLSSIDDIVSMCERLNDTQAEAYKKAKDFIRRNALGDREEAIGLLEGAFDNVFEVPI